MTAVALYARVSSEKQAQRHTIESQLAALKQRMVSDGHVVLPQDVFIDDGASGSTLVRAGLEQLRDRVAEGGIDVLYVHSPDRLARKYAYQVLLLEEFRARLRSMRAVPRALIGLIGEIPKTIHPMDVLRTSVSVLSHFDPDVNASPTDHPKVLKARNASLAKGVSEQVEQLIAAAEEGWSDEDLKTQLKGLVPDFDPSLAGMPARHTSDREIEGLKD